jgi:hypothetical protein
MRLYSIHTQISPSLKIHVTGEHFAYVEAKTGQRISSQASLWTRDELYSVPGGGEALERWWSVRDDEYERHVHAISEAIGNGDGHVQGVDR